MVKLNNDKIYDQTIKYIFDLDTSSTTLSLNMIKLLFQKYEFPEPSEKIIDILKKEYNTSDLSKDNLKKKDQNEDISEEYIKNNLNSFNKNDKLNIDKIYNNISQIDNTIDKTKFTEYISKTIYNNSSDFPINPFKEYIINKLK